ncbi:M28 family peptidase [Telmatocola sphagniphila]|uniref:M28 family peptidase n=2 Tax=Telmatocola sphagniphila TaxID=1123043 RepID=A0A8E6EVF5_9BACT|nr:M28 family peptidase [Telmatocola sphagniphila]
MFTNSSSSKELPEQITSAKSGQSSKPLASTWEAGEPAPFDPDRAMKYLKQLCDLGPRISGSDGMAKMQDLLKKHFENLGAKVTFQKFEGKQRSQPKSVPMANMIISWNPESKTRVILCGHYDTRPIADQERRREDWTRPFLSANDGTSTVALLMELGNHMKKAPKMKVGVDFVIFDGEEWMFDPKRDKFFLGSDYFADNYRDHRPAYTYKSAILLDLFAGINTRFPWEENSRFEAGGLMEEVWDIAKELNVKEFVFERGDAVLDDHMGLNRVGIKAIDIIDFSYPHWHKLTDLPENCSGESMAKVAKVLSVWLQRTK